MSDRSWFDEAATRPRSFLVVGCLVVLGMLVGASSAFAAAPVCTNQSYTVETGQPLPLPVDGPCTDSDGPGLLQGQVVSGPSFGTVGPGPNGGGVYRSFVGYTGPDSLTYRVTDSSFEISNTATVTITVTGESGTNLPPECPDGTVFVPEGGSATIFGNCADPDAGDTISYGCCNPFPAGGSSSFVFRPPPQSPGITYTPFVGTTSTSFGYTATDNHGASTNVTVPISIVPASQRDFESAGDTTTAEPFAAAIETTGPGPVSIDARVATATPPTGYFLLGQEFDIQAPDAASATNPLRLTFEIDASAVPAGTITVFRNGTAVNPCTGAAGVASPNPCAEGAVTQPDGDVSITVLSTQASVWNFGVRTPPATKDDCKKNGWKSYGIFKNQGDCVSFVVTHGKNGPSGG